LATVAELLEQRAALEKQIAEAQREERASAIAQVRALMQQHGLSAADLSARAASPKSTGAKRGGGTPVAPKYRDPATGKTWSGRGLKPNWLKSALANGRSVGDFAI
jgi:DNA-binding protein H-NS